MPLQLLKSKQLVSEIKQRQANELADTLEEHPGQPKLAIVLTVDHPAINAYMGMKQKYGADLGIAVDVHRIHQDDAPALIKTLNSESTVHGIIVQLPLERPDEMEALVTQVIPEKDVDGLGSQKYFVPATPMAILWLIAGYGVDLHNKKVLLIGRGKLVGRPLAEIFRADNIDFIVGHSQTEDLPGEALRADVIITATGRPGLLTADMVKTGAVVVDAGTAGEGGKTVGDVADEVYERDDISVTPKKGGVGPLTVCALFENTIRSYQAQAN